jgi:hypothetical protein
VNRDRPWSQPRSWEFAVPEAEADADIPQSFWTLHALAFARARYVLGYRQGGLDVARELVTRIACKKFGPPTAQQQALLDAIEDVHSWRLLNERLLSSPTWDELLVGFWPPHEQFPARINPA